MAEYYKVINTEGLAELEWFYTHMLRDLKPGESWMICLAARDKKLTEEERKVYFLGRSEMMRESIVRYHHVGEPFKWFSEAVFAYNMDKRGLTTKNGLSYPDKTLMVYLTLNPCSSLGCVHDTIDYANMLDRQMVDSVIKSSKDGIEDNIFKYSKVFDHLKSVHARNPSERLLVDFDLDFNEIKIENFWAELSKVMQEFFPKGSFAIVRTAGGCHIVVKRAVLKCNPEDIVKRLEDWFAANNMETSEVKYNVNKTTTQTGEKRQASPMIPMPGSFCYKKLANNEYKRIMIEVVNKDDFN